MGGWRGRWIDPKFATTGHWATLVLATLLTAALACQAAAENPAAPAAAGTTAGRAPTNPGTNSDSPDDPSQSSLPESDRDGDEFTPEKERTEKTPVDPKKPKPDFSALRLYLTPGDRREPLRFVKPAHWVGARIEARANNFDYKGN